MHDLDADEDGCNDDGQLAEEQDERADRVERSDSQDVVGQRRERLAGPRTEVDAVDG